MGAEKARDTDMSEVQESLLGQREKINKFHPQYKGRESIKNLFIPSSPTFKIGRGAQSRYRANKRKEALEIYGGKCACCGETKYEFLTFDHKYNGHGNPADRNKYGTGLYGLVKYIIKNKPEDIQVLCYNCNMAKAFHGNCPHSV